MSAIAYRIRHSDRALRVRVTVADGEVEVVLPRRAHEREAAAAVRELTPWIERRLLEQGSARDARVVEPGVTRYLDEALVLVTQRDRTRVLRRGSQLFVPEQDLAVALERWYRRCARSEIAPRLDAACACAGLEYKGLTIRAQRTRWASCSSTGTMSFNWRLLLAPEEVLDAVVWHEVCHLAVPDHSARFRTLLERHCPGHRTQERWLRRYGATLTLDDVRLVGPGS